MITTNGTSIQFAGDAGSAQDLATLRQITTALSTLASIATTGSANDLISGTIPTSRLPAFTGGDVTSSTGSAILALGNTTVGPAIYGDASHVPSYTVNSQGRLTSASNVAIAIAAGSVSGLAAIATSGSATDLVVGTVAEARLPSSLMGAHFVVTQTASALTGSVSLGAQTQGLLQHTVATGVSSPSGFHVTTGRIPHGAPSDTGLVTTDARLIWDGSSGGELAVTGLVSASNLAIDVDASVGHTLNVGLDLEVAGPAAINGFFEAKDGAEVSLGLTVLSGDLAVAAPGHVYGIVPWSLPLVTVQDITSPSGLSPQYLTPGAGDRQSVDRRFLFGGFGRSSRRQSLQVVVNSSQVAPGGGTAGYSITWELIVNGTPTGLSVTAPLTPAPGSGTPTSYGTTGTLTIADGAQIAVRETGATTIGSPGSVQWIAYLMLTLF